MDESNEVVQVLTQSTWDNRNRFDVVNFCRNRLNCHSPTINGSNLSQIY